MDSVAAASLVLVATAAVTTSMALLDCYILVFFARALTSVAIVVQFDAGPVIGSAGLIAFLRPSCRAMKLTARRLTSLLTSGGGSRENRVEKLGVSFGVNRDERGSGPCGRRQAVIPGVLGLKHLLVPFCVGRVVMLGSW